jgi:hypothetical protein
MRRHPAGPSVITDRRLSHLISIAYQLHEQLVLDLSAKVSIVAHGAAQAH